SIARTPMHTTLRGSRNRSAWLDDLGRRLRLDDDQWHDGRLVASSVETGKRGSRVSVGATLRVEVYGDGVRAPRRTPLTVAFGGVHEVITTLNGRELVDMGKDHIVFARLNGRRTCWISASTWPAATSASSPSVARYRRA
ncbi:MAG: hypothetical protein ABIU38_27820, partial [Vicinamibacteraceae bacterium]